MGLHQDKNQIPQSLPALIDYLKVIPMATISGKGDREFAPDRMYGSSYVGELTVRLPDGSQLKLSHVMVPGSPGSPALGIDGTDPWKKPTASMVRGNSDRKVSFSDSEARKIHEGVGTRIRYQREESEQRIALMNAEVLWKPENVSWVCCEGSKGTEVFRTQVGNVTMWLSHTVTSFFGFKRDKYELVGRFSCDLYDAASRYTDERARLLFQKVANELQSTAGEENNCRLPKL